MLLSSSKYRKDIQVLRGIAVIAVVFFHAKEDIFPQGYLGVDVFFVISGFVVTPLIIRIFPESIDSPREVLRGLKTFYLRRFFRLAPALGVTLTFSLLLILILAPVSEYLRFAKQGISSLILLGNFGAYFYSGGNYFAPNPNPLIHLWSLSAEEQIYLVLPALLTPVLFQKKKGKFASLIILIAFLGIIAFVLDFFLVSNPGILQSYGVSNPQSLMFYLPISRFYEFAIGALLYLLPLKLVNPPRIFRILSILLLSCLVFLLFGQSKLANLHSLVLSSITALVIFFRSLDLIPGLLRRIGVRLGDYSYSIYLMHMPIIYVAKYSPIFEGKYHELATYLAVLISLATGYTSFKFVEARFRNPQLENFKETQILMHRGVYLLCIPLICFFCILVAADRHYWGKDPNGDAPAMATIEQCGTADEMPCQNLVEGSNSEALLIGDSHAQALSDAFRIAMQSARITSYVFAKSGCQFIMKSSTNLKQAKYLDFDQITSGDSISSTCFQHNEGIRKWVLLHPKAIIYISNRSSSFLPYGFSVSEYGQLLIKNAMSLKALTNQVVLVGPNPEFPDDTQYFSGNLTIWQKPYLPYEKLPRSEMRSEPFYDDKFFHSNLPRIGIKYISSVGIFCTSSECGRKDGKRWLYGAKGHLSIDGANKMVPLLIATAKR